MYDEWGNDIGTAPTWFLTDNGEPSPFDVDIAPPLSVVSKGEDPLVLPGPTGEPSLRLLDDPFVLPGPDSDYGFGLKQGSDDWLLPLSNEGEVTLPGPEVTARRTQPTTPTFWNPYDGGFDGHDTDQDNYRDPDPIEFCDAASDNAAVSLRDAIKDDPNDHRKEHVALIFRDSRGVIMTSPLFEGTDRSANVGAAVNWLISQGFPTGSITGLVHNHDRDYYGRTEDEERLNRYPSDIDWAAAQSIIGLGADPGIFRHYIVDTNGQMREFDYDDRALYEALSLQQKINGRELPPVLEVVRPQCY